MNREIDVEGLKSFLAGFGRRNPVALAVVAECGTWPQLALKEIERRAAAILVGLSDYEVAAIAGQEVDLRKLAEQVQAEMREA